MATICAICSGTSKKTESVMCVICGAYQHYNCFFQQTPTLSQAVKDSLSKTKMGFSFGCGSCAESSINPFGSKLKALEKQIGDLTSIIKNEVASQLSEMKANMASNLSHNKNLEELTSTKIKHLEEENNIIRKQLNRPDVIVTGLKDNLSQDELYSAAVAIGKACGVILSEVDINFCSYINRKTAVLIKFNSVRKRDSIMRNYRKSFNLKLSEIISSDIESRVFLNDHHIPMVAKVHYVCRRMKRSGEIISYKIQNYSPFNIKLTYKNGKEADFKYSEILNTSVFAPNAQEKIAQ